MHKPAGPAPRTGVLLEGRTSLQMSSFVCGLFNPQLPKSQFFPGPPQTLRGVALGKSLFHTRVLCLSSVHHIYSNECVKGPVKLRSYTR